MAIDNTHTKYLKGHDKKVWGDYKTANEAQRNLERFIDGFNAPDLAEGEEYEIPVKKKRK